MKLKLEFNILITVLILLAQISEARPARRNTADIYSIKDNIEKIVGKKYHDALSTRIHPDDFTITVKVDVIRDRKNQSQAKRGIASAAETQFLPGLNGYLSATSIMKIYEDELQKELDASQQDKNDFFEDLKYYRVTSASVFVGLKRDFDKAYQTQLKKWLEVNIRREFGANSRAEVSLISKRPEKVIEEPWWERIKDFQWLLIVIISGLFLVFSLMLYQWFRAYLKKSELRYNEKLKSMELDGDKEIEEAKRMLLDKAEEKERLEKEAAEFEEKIADAQHRVIMAFLNSPNQAATVSSLLTYEEGGIKLAALIDACYSRKGKILLGRKLPESFFRVNIPNNMKMAVERSFVEYKNIEPRKKLKILEGAFWSVSTIDILNDYQQNRPFQYLRSLDPRTIDGMFKDSKLEEKLVSILHLPGEHQRSVLSYMSEEQKLELIEASFEKEVFGGEELEQINQSVQHKFHESLGEFETLSGTLNMLQNMSAIEELKVVSKIRTDKPDVSKRVKDAYLSLAFVDQWTDEHIRLFFETASSHEIGSVIKMIPGSREVILRNVSEMQAVMVSDDLSIESNWNYSKMDKSLNDLRERLKDLQRDNLIDKTSVYGSEEEGEFDYLKAV